MSSPVAALRRTTRTFVVLATALSALTASAIAYAEGIDISRWQHPDGAAINWTQVKADNISFAFIKATEGSSYTNPYFASDRAAAKEVGIYRGAYHFARPSKGTAAKQARYFVSRAGLFKGAGTLPPVLDLEDRGKLGVTALRTWTRNWLSTVEELTGRTPMIYTSPYFWETYLGNARNFTHYRLWVAHYGVSSPRVPGGWSTWTFWQRTSSGHVDGIRGNVDMNRFNGTSAQLAALAQASGGGTAPPPPGTTVPTGEATTLSLGAGRTYVGIGGSVIFAGDLLASKDGTPVAGRWVGLWSRPKSGSIWTKLSTAPTDSAGHYTARATVVRSSVYQARFAGGPKYAATVSPQVTVSTPPRTTTALGLHADKYRVRAGSVVMLYGRLTTVDGGLADRRVKVYTRPAGGRSWTYLKSVTTASAGRYQAMVRPKRARTYKTVFAGSRYYKPVTSNRITVRVR